MKKILGKFSKNHVCVCVCVYEIGQEGVCVASFPLKLGDDEEGVLTSN